MSSSRMVWFGEKPLPGTGDAERALLFGKPGLPRKGGKIRPGLDHPIAGTLRAMIFCNVYIVSVVHIPSNVNYQHLWKEWKGSGLTALHTVIGSLGSDGLFLSMSIYFADVVQMQAT